MKKLFIVLRVAIEKKPHALLPLFLLICGKPHAPAPLGQPIASGSELAGCARGRAGSFPLTATRPPASAGPAGAQMVLPQHVSRGHGLPMLLSTLVVGQRGSQPFAMGPASGGGAKPGGEEKFFAQNCLVLQLCLFRNVFCESYKNLF